MIKINKKNKDGFVLSVAFGKAPEGALSKSNKITEFVSKKEAVIFIKDEKKYNKEALGSAIDSILKNNDRSYQINVKSFIKNDIKEMDVIEDFIYKYEFKNGEIYNEKTNKKPEDKAKDLFLINVSKDSEKKAKKAFIVSDAITFTKNLQITPPNILNSETYAKDLTKEFKKYPNIKFKVLNKKEIQDLGMGLFLGVNLGSAFEPRVVIMEHKGNPSSKDKTVMVGKGIVFDAGGYNIKTGRFMGGMKYDMSGSAIVAGAMKAIAQLKPKSNISGILMLTDNMISPVAITPDMVLKSMSGKTVEINNTDAEGRLALADGLTYSVKKLGATRLIDVATLTGAVIAALGNTYTGTWATSDAAWNDIYNASKAVGENVWRLPFHSDYIKYMKGSTVADLKNTDLTGNAGSSSAAMFLKEFTENKEYIHLDVAGTADVNHSPKGVMVKTLVELANK